MKKIVVIADIHSNYSALKSAFDAVKIINPDGIIFLGDYVTDFPYTQRTMELLYKMRSIYKCFFIRGNREDYILEHRKNPNDGWCCSSSVGSLLYTYENLIDADLDFFESLPIFSEIEIVDFPLITACHGSPKNTRENLLRDCDLRKKYLNSINGNILLCGHTHHKKIIKENDKQIVFCPSLGLPQDNEKFGHTEFTLLSCSGNAWQTEFVDIKYDADTLISEYRQSELPKYAPIFSECIIKSIETNRDVAYECVVSAWKYAKADNYAGGLILPEKYWQMAAKELNII